MGEAGVIHIQSMQLVGPAREDFKIDSLSQADWALEVLGGAEARKTENKAIADEARRRIDDWQAEANRLEDSGVALVRAQLESFMSAQRPLILGAKTTKKSRSFPHGILGWRSSQRRLEVEREEETLSWAKARPVTEGLVRWKAAINRDALSMLAERENLTPPGTRWAEATDEAFIRPVVAGLLKTTTKGDG